MEFDILNQLLTSTVYDLFAKKQTTPIESKMRVKQLENLSKNQSSRRQSSVDSRDSQSSVNLTMISDSSSRGPGNQTPIRQCGSVQQWIKVQAPRRLKQSISRLGITLQLIKNRGQLDSYVDSMPVDTLNNQKKKVKNELRNYDNDFNELFKYQPTSDQKEPFRPLYVYYKKLKQYINKKGASESTLSQDQIQKKIRDIKNQRKQLRQQIQQYQKDFQQTNNRRIRYARDIAPIDKEYKKYKDLKNQLLKLEDMLNK